MKESEVPPLDEEARALLQRTKRDRSEPFSAPADVRARVFGKLEAAIGVPEEEDDRAGTPASAAANDDPYLRRTGRTASALGRSWRVAFWIAAAAVPALVALGARMRARLMSALEPEHAVISAAPCGGPRDSHNCGRCGHDCCGGACADGVCQPLVIAQGYHPGVATVDSSYVYWPDGSDSLGRIMKAPKEGGEPTVVASNQRRPWAVAVDAEYAYWVTNRDDPPDYGGVYKVPLTGGDVVALVPTGEPLAGDIAVDESGVYWDDYGAYPPGKRNPLECARGAAIRRVGLDGTNPTTLAGADSGVCTPLFFALDRNRVYWPSRSHGAIQSVGRGGRGFTKVALSGDPMAVAVDSSSVYWVNWEDGSVQSAPLAGGEPVTIASSGRDAGPNGGVGAVDVAVDEANVYWARQGPPWGASGAILSAPLDATRQRSSGGGGHGDVGVVIATSPDPVNMTTDATCIYWVDGSDGKIRTIAKP